VEQQEEVANWRLLISWKGVLFWIWAKRR
jgi:hypothetical protein